MTKTKGGYAEVYRVTPDSEAERSNVLVGSYIVGLNGHKISLFEEIVSRVKELPRPIRFQFVVRRKASDLHHVSSISTVPEPEIVETVVVCDVDQHLGCSFFLTEYYCVVQIVEKGNEKNAIVGVYLILLP